MKLYKAILALAVVTVLHPSVAPAQLDVSTVTARAGLIRSLWPDNSIYSPHLWSFYPELEIGGAFFKPFLSWGVSWGYWSDRINQALPIMDLVTYSHTSHILGLRIGFHPELADDNRPIPVAVFGGFAYHVIKASYIGGLDFMGSRGLDSKDHSTTAHLGLSLTVPIVTPFSLSAEVQQFLPLGNSGSDEAQKNRRAFKVGVLAKF